MTDVSAPGPDRRAFLRQVSAAAAGVAAIALHAAAAVAPPAQPGAAMLARQIPRTRERLPVVGLGTWQTFNPPRLTDDALAELTETLRVFHDAGGRVVDSSPMYGESERVVGMLSERLRINQRLFIATKVWTAGGEAGVRQMGESMSQLRRKTIDLMQVHNLVDWRTHLRTLRRWKEEGRVRYVGITHYLPSSYDELERIVTREGVDFVQLAYSVGVRDAERRLLPAAADAGVAVIVNRPFEGGTLFRRVVGTPVPDAVRTFAPSWPQAFLKFIVAHPAVTCVIPGTGNPRHMRDNVQAGFGRLPDTAERGALLRALGLAER